VARREGGLMWGAVAGSRRAAKAAAGMYVVWSFIAVVLILKFAATSRSAPPPESLPVYGKRGECVSVLYARPRGHFLPGAGGRSKPERPKARPLITPIDANFGADASSMHPVPRALFVRHCLDETLRRSAPTILNKFARA
jgi:hypothetical protein